MNRLLQFAHFIDLCNRQIGRASVWLILGAVLLSALAATLRYLFDWGSNAMIEAQWFLFGLVFLLCAPWTLQEQGHVRVDIIYTRLSTRWRAIVDIVGGLLFLLPVCILISVNAWDYFLLSFQQNESSMNPGGLLWWPMKLAIPIAFSLLAAQGVAEIIKAVAVLRNQSASKHGD
ncbi:TRAP transporter small permease subunit [Chromatium okenii]|jgi:TRAP-type mannitol/chloroaromatic compound transport system permease small subunit|uniref:TRAP transporter small permease protein n=1 Tax=Chromatium okenii TaxID=61644 RepID=A0A2S7XR74_9GAMM|nr:TRAP transporter small permease subunit [Chromatium okenii]MBV5307826.1 TRAP transporter small permease subunit [Chromatium okenii]PQJ95901.1 C4-dicarboxylate ABC transporter [Chromatium okenii]PQJ97265.1 C4-dicarboxylate ABC transporter [Chromatium okenii]